MACNRWLYPNLILAGLVIAAAGLQLLPIAAVRWGAALVLLVQIFQERRHNDSQFLTSPLFLLGAISLLLFSFVLGLADTSFPGSHMKNIETYFGSDSERVFIIFGMCCIAAHGLAAGRPPPVGQATAAGRGPALNRIYLFAAMAVIVSLVNVANYLSFKSGGPQVTAIRSLAPPLLAFCLAYLVRLAVAAGGREKLLIAAIILLSVAGLLVVHEGKKPLLMAVAGLLYWLRLKDVSIKNLIAAGAAFAVATIILVQVVQIIRVPHQSMRRVTEYGDSPGAMFVKVLNDKLVLRQTETRYCFHNVIGKHGNQPLVATRQLFWLKALVPRLFWPGKPSLSLGQDYAYQYCGIRAKSTHTASITLLGQPVIYGGWAGLLLHGGLLIAGLAGLVRLGRNRDGVAAVTVVALLPWLIDFDQDFALYVANAVKFFLVMLPLVLLTARMDRPPG